MTKNIFSFLLLIMLVVGFASFNKASAETYPEGCSSAIGYSITTGQTCNGENEAITGFLPGCTTALGYSTVNGAPCSGGEEALQFLAGCTDITGYSTQTGAPCNGTSVATLSTGGTPGTPGLPLTGPSSDLMTTIATLIGAGLFSIFGFRYLMKPNTIKK